MRPFLFLIAGPNGAGKSTFYELRLENRVRAPFVNADVIQRDELMDPSLAASYRASEIAEARRDAHLRSRRSLVVETVFSHASKLAFVEAARSHGFVIVMYHIGVQGADLSVARVKERVEEGGHDVPEHKIRERYDRNGPIIRQAVLQADKAFVIDNSSLDAPFRQVLAFDGGVFLRADAPVPAWASSLYGEYIR